SVADMAASFQERAAEMLTSRLISAAKDRKLPAALCGGVAANEELRRMVSDEAEKNGIKTFFADRELCGDNAAMVASAGFYEFMAGHVADLSLNACATREIDEE
ncbi:MAG: tRNA (adenosine(37)-N6)-threonylcarbamoyltransferase complex transferase subunit TsaD, partial [Oscillospiraceae bacterium]|nr:tRNA (adenosine(37)-N6)-threonylcarbamoyltransferase complex transferase subunit TsaD [Oscillospiraceae bacterium]